ncbi:Pollen Ole e 1 allergen/extensin [Quillaja saponaria]|uniref:Pollen Ole e 1 allergen/extensin n=1 Tax=Quillaja saponaria TaxID=32244 RepID=A0AAD7KVL8_QUISA|nr:Pollen Ole e 1 allergen/extensin [Quillaja saponaria]
MMLLLLCFIFFHGSPVTGQENPFFELPSQQEFLQMAGYGEEKLSTVLFTGSVHCEACLHGEADHFMHGLYQKCWLLPTAISAGRKANQV